MNQAKYIGMDVHQATISVAVMDSAGKLILESVLETKAATILQFVAGLRGSLLVTFEEGTSAAWLYDLLKPHVANVLVCDPRKNALLKDGSKSDRIDARKLAELLRGNHLSPIYHGENGVRTLKELARSYLTITKDLTRVMSRIKAVYRSWAIPCAGPAVYRPRHRAEWLAKIENREFACEPSGLPATGCVGAFAAGSTPRPASGKPETSCGEITASDSLSGSDSFRLAGGAARDTASFSYQATAVGLQRIRTRDSRQRRIPLCERATATKPERVTVLGLNQNHNHDLKNIFKSAAISASTRPGPFQELSRTSGERKKAGNGATYPGTEDRIDHFDDSEERSVLRRRKNSSASSLSVSGRELFDPPGWWSVWFLRRLVRGKYQIAGPTLCASARSHRTQAIPLGGREIAICHEPRIEPWSPRNRIVCQLQESADVVTTRK